MKLIFILSLSTFLFLSGCGQSAKREKLFNTYKEVLITRETITDSLKANKAVNKVLKKNGYTEIQFRNEIFELARSEKDFLKTIDSLRNFVKFEQKRILDSLNKKSKKNEKRKAELAE
jgi:hypothetical protein